MDSRSEILEVLEGVYGRRSGRTLADTDLTKDDKRFIEQHFALVRRRPFNRTSCGQCYVDALIEMLLHLRKNELMPQSNYKLKRGIVLQMASDPNAYTNGNLTDKVAEKYLKDNPKRIGLFEVYPEDWETRIGKKAAVKPKVGKKESAPKQEEKPEAPKTETETDSILE